MYALIVNGAFVREVNIRTDYPNISFPRPILAANLPEGVVEVTINNPPPRTHFDVVIQQDPTFNATLQQWEINYTIRAMTPQELVDATPSYISLCAQQVQLHLDTTAQSRNYDGILSLCTYSTSANPTFAAEGVAGVAFRDDVWTACYQILADVQASLRTAPTPEALIVELPAIVWPV